MDISTFYFTENVNIQTLLFGLVILLIIQWFVARSNYNLPPGPIAFPIIGNLPQIISSTDLYLKIGDLRKQYGDIFRLKVGSDNFVFVCKTELILEGLVKKGEQLKGICNWVYIFDKVFQRKGVSFNSGKEWKDLRRFIMSTFRDLGIGKTNTEKKIYLETLTLGEFFESHNGKPFSLSNPMSYYSLIIIYSIIFGERIAFGEPEIMEILENFKFFFKHVSAVIPENFIPFLRFLRWNSPIENVIKKRQELRSYVKTKIIKHKKRLMLKT
ncbi:cytochrome P450 2B10-like isoform X1 [Octopus sinensis]|uniref:Cytochrome P450 2B10-like isoform X1 n=1 Tax=Octopus sinensis TaxID=2607531 RepID=A0A7E6F649_9MOLL|nr:cytochrome P450 2B10-like isoform X1 [Octopus sinensis]